MCKLRSNGGACLMTVSIPTGWTHFLCRWCHHSLWPNRWRWLLLRKFRMICMFAVLLNVSAARMNSFEEKTEHWALGVAVGVTLMTSTDHLECLNIQITTRVDSFWWLLFPPFPLAPSTLFCNKTSMAAGGLRRCGTASVLVQKWTLCGLFVLD